jgi:hypothetical protein
MCSTLLRRVQSGVAPDCERLAVWILEKPPRSAAVSQTSSSRIPHAPSPSFVKSVSSVFVTWHSNGLLGFISLDFCEFIGFFVRSRLPRSVLPHLSSIPSSVVSAEEALAEEEAKEDHINIYIKL